MDEQRLRTLLDAGRALLAELDYEAVLSRLLEVARELTGARYAALGVLDERREGLERFVTSGLDEATERAIGDRPHGRGVLGLLIEEPRPLRLLDVGRHPQSYGFPLAHPPMHTFLGVPILIRGEAWGNLYLTDRADGEFTGDDEEAVVVLAEWASLAISNARLYRDVTRRRDELERVNRGLETTTEISRELGGETDLDRVLELIAKRSRALVAARTVEIGLLDSGQLVVAAVAGEASSGVVGTRLGVEDSVAGAAMRSGRLNRVDDIPSGSFAHLALGARSAIVAPMAFKGRLFGFLMAFDRLGVQGFSADDERLLEAFAASAATAVATAQSAAEEALRRSLEASELERGRWARELHDETLQELAGLRMLLSGARRSGDPARLAEAVDDALEIITGGVANLRALIADLRPGVLDELGLAAALESLAERAANQLEVDVELDVRLAAGRSDEPTRLPPEIESVAYRLVQEALTNVSKHAGVERAHVSVRQAGDALEIAVRDEGRGFAPGAQGEGFGLVGMRERIALVRGALDVRSTPGEGTCVSARIPVARHGGTAQRDVEKPQRRDGGGAMADGRAARTVAPCPTESPSTS
jgi:signal transduction histidine kinase